MSYLDDSLTSLRWLQDFNHGAHGPSPPPHQHASLLGQGAPSEEVDYATDPSVKPPISYAMMICMAMEASQRSKLSLSSIYTWITENYSYFRHADPTWQNSIRHNLSVNKCFIKVPRRKDEPGKGGFWTIDPQYAKCLLSSAYKKRRSPAVQKGRLPPGAVSVEPRCQQILQEFEEATGAEQQWDPQLAEGTMLGSQPVSWGSGRKRKTPLGSRAPGSQAKVQRTSSPLLCVEEQNLGSLKESCKWDSESVPSEDLSLDGPQSPIPMEVQDLIVHGTQIFPVEDRGTDNYPFHNQALLEETFLLTSTVCLDRLYVMDDLDHLLGWESMMVL